MDEKLQAELTAIKTGLETKTASEIKTALDAFETKLSASNKTAFEVEIKAVKDAMQTEIDSVKEHANKLDAKLQEKSLETKSGEDTLVKSIELNFKDISEVRKGKSIQTKVVGNMTLGANLTGDEPRVYNNNVVLIPGQMLNVSDLVGSVNIAGGTYTYPREGAGEGAIAAQTEGSSKAQRDYDFTMVDLATNFIAGFTRYSKKMANNLPFLTSFIPNALRRDYAIAENAAFNTVLAAAATASTEIITGQNKVEMLIAEIAKQEALNYPVNGIVVRPADYWDILITEKSAGAGYGLPGIVTLEGGQLRINGIPLLKANWLAANKYYVGDWSRVNKIVTEGLSLEFSETEGTNFVTNNITARIEAQVGLAVEQPAAIIYGDFTAVA